MTMTDTFTTQLYTLSDAGQIRDAIDLIFQSIDRALWDGKAPEVARVVDAIDVSRLDRTLRRSLAVACSWAYNGNPTTEALAELRATAVRLGYDPVTNRIQVS